VSKTPVVFVWHQHQPGYAVGSTPAVLPWVRLHCVKDYLPLLILTKELQANWVINFTPILLEQLVMFLEGFYDYDFQLMQKCVSNWSCEEKDYLVSNWLPRIHGTIYDWSSRLLELKKNTRSGCDWTDEELNDFVCIINLSWMQSIEDDLRLDDLIKKGHGFTYSDVNRICEIQRKAIAKMLVMLSERTSTLELTTSPYSHPILPLLISTKAGQLANSHIVLPKTDFAYLCDAMSQIQYGLESFNLVTGLKTQGFWPSEMAVDHSSIKLIADAGIQWIPLDEGILSKTYGINGSTVAERKAYYRIYDHEGMKIFFRDRMLSDLIGFEYNKMPEEQAASDLVERLERLSSALDENHVITIALDGENCWEFYPNQGKVFLRKLVEYLTNHPSLVMTTPTKLLEHGVQTVCMSRIAPGSWIYSNLDTWIGHFEKNRLWERLLDLRKRWPVNASKEAWKSLMITEGSDWFWWAGDDHISPDKDKFRITFEEHINESARLAGLE